MDPIPCIAVFDIGKTNKKLLLFDEDYRVLHETGHTPEEIKDEDGFPCEDLSALRIWIHEALAAVIQDAQWDIRALAFAAYGASLVYLDRQNELLTPLYNYLKPYPADLLEQLHEKYGPPGQLSLETASPELGSLNAGLQLYRLKMKQPAVYRLLHVALHFPNYLSFLFTERLCTERTSIGCHTRLWDFARGRYHTWVAEERMTDKLPGILPASQVFPVEIAGKIRQVGVGLHDSSAALVPYLKCCDQPFVLLSTGTWSVCMNPFNEEPLRTEELEQDCLCYLSFRGNAIKASRLFAGYEYEKQAGRIAAHFGQPLSRYTSLSPDRDWLEAHPLRPLLHSPLLESVTPQYLLQQFSNRSLHLFENDIDAYHQLVQDIVLAEVVMIKLVLGRSAPGRLYVDGGFARNELFMEMLSVAFPGMLVMAATMPQATAIGAAMAIHESWNTRPVNKAVIQVKRFGNNYANRV